MSDTGESRGRRRTGLGRGLSDLAADIANRTDAGPGRGLGALIPDAPDASQPDPAYDPVSEVITFPSSTRCAASRFHKDDEKLLMTWRNGKTPWIYHDVDVSVYANFVSAPSQGVYVNQVLNYFAHNKIYPGDPYSQYVYGAMPNA